MKTICIVTALSLGILTSAMAQTALNSKDKPAAKETPCQAVMACLKAFEVRDWKTMCRYIPADSLRQMEEGARQELERMVPDEKERKEVSKLTGIDFCARITAIEFGRSKSGAASLPAFDKLVEEKISDDKKSATVKFTGIQKGQDGKVPMTAKLVLEGTAWKIKDMDPDKAGGGSVPPGTVKPE